MLDPLQIFKSKQTGKVYVSNKSIIRPTFSYIGKFTMAEKVFRDIVDKVVEKQEGIKKAEKVRIIRNEETNEIFLYIQIIFIYGFNIQKEVEEFRRKIYDDLEEYTQINIIGIDIKIKDIEIEN